jgi:hypothetical protein
MSGVDAETKSEPRQERHFCVLGAGASGLVVMKELNEIGIKVRGITPGSRADHGLDGEGGSAAGWADDVL